MTGIPERQYGSWLVEKLCEDLALMGAIGGKTRLVRGGSLECAAGPILRYEESGRRWTESCEEGPWIEEVRFRFDIAAESGTPEIHAALCAVMQGLFFVLCASHDVVAGERGVRRLSCSFARKFLID